MLTAEEILARTVTPETEPHIVINADRTVTVPPELRVIAVQFDHNIETVTFDCPRYWDEHDLSNMRIFINYTRADKKPGQFYCTDVTIDESDEKIMHFTWTITGYVTEAVGEISFLVCAQNADEEGNLTNCWSSLLNEEMSIARGLRTSGELTKMYPDAFMSVLRRLDSLVHGSCGYEPPTTTTVGSIGSLYMDLNTGKMYKCVDTTDGVYTWRRLDGVGIASVTITEV